MIRPSPCTLVSLLLAPMLMAGSPEPPDILILAQQRPAVVGQSRWLPSDPLRIGGGTAYVDIGLVGTLVAGGSTAHDIEGGTQLGGHDPNQRGFTVQGVELNLAGAVDPYFRGNVNVLYALDSQNDSFLELEEAWLETMSLPMNLQLRAGQIFTELGRHNPTHLHTWAFVDAPLVNGRFLGPDGLRNPGARLSWLMPLPIFSELSVGIQNSHGETAAPFRGEAGHGHGDEDDNHEATLPFAFRDAENDRGVRNVDDLLLSARYALSLDLSSSLTLLGGVSGAVGPNNSGDPGANTRTEIYGADVFVKWSASRQQAGYPFVAWQSEVMMRRYETGAFDWDQADDLGDADGNGFSDEGILVDPGTFLPAFLPRERLTDYGLYTQLLYGFHRGWVAGLRFDYLWSDESRYEQAGLLLADNAGGGEFAGPDLTRASRWRLSPNLTWYPTEYSKLRLQYNYDDRRHIGEDHSIWLQFEFILGAHASHRF
jgi:hypothetical protein